MHQYLVAVGGTSDQSLHGFTDLPAGTQVPFIAVYRAEDMVLTWAKAYYLPDYAFSKVAASLSAETFAATTSKVGPSAELENFAIFVNYTTGDEMSVIAYPYFPSYEVLLFGETNLYLANLVSSSFLIVTSQGVSLVGYNQPSFFHFSRVSMFQYRAFIWQNDIDGLDVTSVEIQNKGGIWIQTACAPYQGGNCLPQFAVTSQLGWMMNEDIYFVTRCTLYPNTILVTFIQFLYTEQIAAMPLGMMHNIDNTWAVINLSLRAKLIILYSCTVDGQMFISQFNIYDGSIQITPLMQPGMSGSLRVKFLTAEKIFMGFRQTKKLSFLSGGAEFQSGHTFGSIFSFQPAFIDYCYDQSPISAPVLNEIISSEPNFQMYTSLIDISCPFLGYAITSFKAQSGSRISQVNDISMTSLLKIDSVCPPPLQKNDFNSVDQTFNLVVTDSVIIQGLDQYLLATQCQGQIIFDTFINGVQAELDSSFQLDPFLSLIVVDIFIKTGVYSMKLVPQYVPTVIQGTYYSLKLDIIKNSGPPLFEEELQQSLEINQGDTLNLMLPQINDPDEDKFQIRLRQQPIFVNWGQNQSQIRVQPQRNTPANDYEIIVELSDMNKGIRLKKAYTFTIKVTELIRSNTSSNEIKKGSEEIEQREIEEFSSNIQKDGKPITVKIHSIDSYGIAKIKFGSMDEKLMAKISKDKFIMYRIPRGDSYGDEPAERLNYDILEFQGQTLIVNLKFEDSLSVSTFQNQDYLQLFNKQLIANNKDSLEYIPKGLLDEATIPPQISEGLQAFMQELKGSVTTASITIITSNFLINLVLSSSLSYLWGALNVLQSLTILSLMSLSVPGPARVVLLVAMQLSQMDILPADDIYDATLTFEADEPVNEFFDQGGYQSTSSIRNLGSSYLYGLLVLGVGIFILIGKSLHSKLNARIQRIISKVQDSVCYNFFIRFVLQSYQQFALVALINITHLQMIKSGDALSALATPLLASIVLLAPPTTYFLLKKSSNPTFPQKFGSLSEGLRTNTSMAQHWSIVFMLKRLITVLVIICLREHTVFQLQILTFISLLYQLAVIQYRPLESPADNKLEIFNELTVSCCLYSYMLLTDFLQSPSARMAAGWGLTATILGNIGVNMTISAYQSVLQIKFKYQFIKRSLKAFFSKVSSRTSKDSVVSMKPLSNPQDQAVANLTLLHSQEDTLLKHTSNTLLSHTRNATTSSELQPEAKQIVYRRKPPANWQMKEVNA
ncbi:hypothetical protein FGO68_gene6948 [Halteria grandinella]|uniref:TRP C-terminal domain-containing protein n=1 Tax=Halteria grandinella TaxID=5974 RepID=A0A8J8P179_HALGN|nr:hypothetical protein FGO68_gene6948 [Halteria grandinella]